MEFDHGKRITQHVFEMSPLERAIAEFEKKAKDFHTPKVAPVNETPEQRLARENACTLALAHLKRERLLLDVVAQVQTELDYYREELKRAKGDTKDQRDAKRKAMAQEHHHPTDTLARFMKSDGRPQPSIRHTAHHIAPGKGKTLAAVRARANLHFHGIRINDPDNGTWMPMRRADKGHWSMPNAPSHSQIHTHNYEVWVERLSSLAVDEHTMRAALIRVRTLLRDGKQPKEVTLPPDKEWNGV